MKRHKIFLVIGGFMVGVAAVGKPYDFTNILALCLGVIWIADAWFSLPDK